MARLHEFQGKAILRQHGLSTPRGGAAASPDEAAQIATSLNCPVVLKIQAWTTGRAALGGVAFADTPAQARDHAARLLKMTVGAFPVPTSSSKKSSHSRASSSSPSRSMTAPAPR